MSLFGWLRENRAKTQLIKEQADEIARLREDLEKAQHEAAVLRLKKITNVTPSQREAERKGCLRGEYCRNCIHGTLIDYEFKQKCLCTYGECQHFKEREATNNEPA